MAREGVWATWASSTAIVSTVSVSRVTSTWCTSWLMIVMALLLHVLGYICLRGQRYGGRPRLTSQPRAFTGSPDPLGYRTPENRDNTSRFRGTGDKAGYSRSGRNEAEAGRASRAEIRRPADPAWRPAPVASLPVTPDRPDDRVHDVPSASVGRMAGSGSALRRHDSTSAHATGRSRSVAGVLAVGYGVAVVLIGFWGTPVDARVQPLLARVVAAAQRRGAPSWFGYELFESLANVAFFVPLGLLVVLLAGARWWWAGAAAGLLVSAAIETGQALFLPARFATIDDVVANTMGAVVGALLGVVLLGVAARRRR
ncbi:hypothetical protein DEI95_11965 [Curtobacterium sp. MCBD17_008]|nr:hypothetical protein DEI95_11965 [Curtobacterium sp. MCBD17_008]